MEIALSDQPLTIGRNTKADVVLEDEKASRLHCGIRLMDGEYFIKDLDSKNGTFVNEQRIESSQLNAGDKIRVGSTTLSVEKEASKGATTAFEEMEQEMSVGKGYHTILREIVDDAKTPPPKDPS